MILFVGNVTVFAKEVKVSIKNGATKTLETDLKNAVWGSTDTSVVKVSQKGKITALSVGSCYVSATANGKTDLFSITVTKKKSSGKKITVKKDGTYGDLIYYIDGHKLVLSSLTVEQMMNELGADYCLINRYDIDYHNYTDNEAGISRPIYSIISDAERINTDSKDIITRSDTYYLIKGDNVIAELYLKVSDTAYFKDMTVSAIQLIEYSKNSYFMSKLFSLSNAPEFDNFDKEAKAKFVDNYGFVSTFKGGNTGYVTIENNSGCITLIMCFTYNTKTRQCEQIEVETDSLLCTYIIPSVSTSN